MPSGGRVTGVLESAVNLVFTLNFDRPLALNRGLKKCTNIYSFLFYSGGPSQHRGKYRYIEFSDIFVAGPSITARVELSGLSGDEVSTQANLTNLTKIFIQILPAILTSDAHISAQPNDTSLHQTSCIQYITVHRRKSVLNTSLIHQVKTPANSITLNYQVSLTP